MVRIVCKGVKLIPVAIKGDLSRVPALKKAFFFLFFYLNSDCNKL